MNRRIFLGIDNGNKCTKTSEGFVYETGYVKSEYEPISKKNLIKYNGEFYTIAQNRLSVQLDKSDREDTWILSLAAIGDKLEKEGIEEGQEVNIIVGTGLPLIHYSKQKEKFKNYFIRNNVEFEYNQKLYKVNVIDNRVYPQGYSAMLTVYNSYKDIQVTNIIDLGGYTTDLFLVEKGILNVKSCNSFTNGVITLIGDIKQELLKNNVTLTEHQIEDTIRSQDVVMFDADINEIIIKMAENYVTRLIDHIVEVGFEFRNPTIFIGGGALMLKGIIEKDPRLKYVEFLDQFANAKGYLMLLKQEFKEE